MVGRGHIFIRRLTVACDGLCLEEFEAVCALKGGNLAVRELGTVFWCLVRLTQDEARRDVERKSKPCSDGLQL